MSDRISQLATQKRKDETDKATQSDAAEEARCQATEAAATERVHQRAAIKALARRFFEWTKRNNVPPGLASANHAPLPRGWVIGYFAKSWSAGYDQYSYTTYGLVMKTNGELVTTIVSSGKRAVYRRDKSVDLANFSVNSMEDTIAGIVVRSGKRWP